MDPSRISSEDLISPDYLAEQKRLHESGYGQRGGKWSGAARSIADRLGVKTILDYGCGQADLADKLIASGWPPERLWSYDPAVQAFANLPPAADLVMCTDVLEHVEPNRIDRVLWHLRSLTKVALFTVISRVETAKTLSDGRQAHILLKPWNWWLDRFSAHGFELANDKQHALFHNFKPEKQFVNLWGPT